MSQNNIKFLKDENQTIFSPIVSCDSVFNNNGVSLQYSNTIKEGTYKIGTWIDGKPIYRIMKTTTFGSSLNEWNELFTINNLYCLFWVHGIWDNSKSLFTSPYADTSKNEFINFYFNGDENKLYEKHNYEYVNGCNHFVICEYVGLV